MFFLEAKSACKANLIDHSRRAMSPARPSTRAEPRMLPRRSTSIFPTKKDGKTIPQAFEEFLNSKVKMNQCLFLTKQNVKTTMQAFGNFIVQHLQMSQYLSPAKKKWNTSLQAFVESDALKNQQRQLQQQFMSSSSSLVGPMQKKVIFVASGVHSLHLGSPYWLF